jgi:hypothetical protein
MAEVKIHTEELTLPMLRELMEVKFAESELRYQQRFDAQTKGVEAAFAASQSGVSLALTAQEKAAQKAEIAIEKRFESVNEFRAQLTDQTRTFIPRQEAQSKIDDISLRLTKVEALQQQSSGAASKSNDDRGQRNWAIGQTMSIIAAVIAVGAVIVDILTRAPAH